MTKVRANQTEVEEILNDPAAAASEIKKGTIQIATQAEVDAGIDSSRMVSPNTLANYVVFSGLVTQLNDLSDVSIGGSPLEGTALKNIGGTWTNATVLSDIVEDLSPQLGADLDVNNFTISSQPNGKIKIISASSSGVDSGNIQIASGYSDTGTGYVSIRSWSSQAPTGAVSLYSGNSSGVVGLVKISSGNSTIQNGGDIDILAGDQIRTIATTKRGGNINITAGNSQYSSTANGDVIVTGGGNIFYGLTGGKVSIRGGTGEQTTGTGGNVELMPGAGGVTQGKIQIHAPLNKIGTGSLQLWDDTNTLHTTGTNVEIKAPSVAGSPPNVVSTWTMTLPSNAGSNGYALITDGSGITSWVSSVSNPLTSDLNVDTYRIISNDTNPAYIQFPDIADTTTYLIIRGREDFASTNSGTNTNSRSVFITGGDSASSADGGTVVLRGGVSTGTGQSGAVYIGDQEATISSSVDGSNVIIKGGRGRASSAKSGDVLVSGGYGFSFAAAGDCIIQGGFTVANSTTHGNVIIRPHNTGGNATSTVGKVIIESAPTTTNNIEFHTGQSVIGQAGIKLWNDTNTAHTTGNYVELRSPTTAGSPAIIPTDWAMTLPPNSGTNGDILVTDGNGVTQWETPQVTKQYVDANDRLTINVQTGTTYTLALTDENALVTMNNAAANTLTIPQNASVGFPIGSQIVVSQEGAGQTTISGGTGSPPAVTIHSAGNLFSLASQYTTISLIKKATDTWLIVGDLV